MKKSKRILKYILLGLTISKFFLSINSFSQFKAQHLNENLNNETTFLIETDKLKKYEDLGSLLMSDERIEEIKEKFEQARSQVPPKININPRLINVFKKYNLQVEKYLGGGCEKDAYLVTYKEKVKPNTVEVNNINGPQVNNRSKPQYCAVVSTNNDEFFCKNYINLLCNSPKILECKYLTNLCYFPGEKNMQFYIEDYDGKTTNLFIYLMEYNNLGTLQDFLILCCAHIAKRLEKSFYI